MRLVRRVLLPGVAAASVVGFGWAVTNKEAYESNLRLARCARTIATMSGDYFLVTKTSLFGGEDSDKLHQAHRRNAVRLRELVFANKGIYIKVGQHLAILTYILPDEYTDELKQCFEHAPVSSRSQVDEVIRSEFGGKGIDDLFSSFEENPIASASLAQVHRATTHDGRPVAVKVQHPHLRDSADSEITAIARMVNLARKLQPDFGFEWLVEEMRLNLPLELDFRVEAANADRCRVMLSGFGDAVVVPQVDHEMTTPRVMVMNFEEGCRLNEMDLIRKQGLSPGTAGRLLTQVFCEMIFKHGFVHCDPHPGNVLVRPHPRRRHTPQLVILDHGLYRELPHDLRVLYCELWKAVITGNTKAIFDASSRMGISSPWMKAKHPEDDMTHTLIASMLMAHPWDVIANKGSSMSRFAKHAESSRKDLRGNVQEYLRGIVDVLESVPRPVLLMLKTNDCLRCVSFDLGVSSLDTCLLTARACIDTLISDLPRRNLFFVSRLFSLIDLRLARLRCDFLLLATRTWAALGWSA